MHCQLSMLAYLRFSVVLYVVCLAIACGGGDPGPDNAPDAGDVEAADAAPPGPDAGPAVRLGLDRLDLYVSLGDSMSEHDSPRQFPELLYRNDDALFPQWAGKDFETRFPSSTHIHRASGGDIIEEVLDDQIPGLQPHAGTVLVTLTIGGNDFKQDRTSIWNPAISHPLADEFEQNLQLVVDRLEEKYTGELYILVATIHDPGDDQETIYDRSGLDENENVCAILILLEGLGVQDAAHANLAYWNTKYPTVAAARDSLYVADLYTRFLGHGVNAGDPSNPHHDAEDPITWIQSDCVHPNDRGDSEIRRLFWEMTE